MSANKVQFGLKNVYYAKITWNGSTPTFATPVAIPGAVNLTLNASGDNTKFYADNLLYYHTVVNNGYEGTLELAKIPDAFLTDIFGFTNGQDHVLVENSNTEPAHAALLFQIDGDADQELYAFYDCSFSRPSIASATLSTSKEPITQSLDIVVAPLASGKVLSRTTSTTATSVKSAWFTTVYTG